MTLPANLAAHYRRMLARPAVYRVLREEGYDTAALGRLSAGQSTDLATS
jgi:glutathione S-transferase